MARIVNENQVRDEVAKFYNNEFSKFDRSGIVVMRIKGFVDAGGHTTLWNGKDKHFEDFEISENYLIGNHNVVDFQFWELKG
ncbi:MULTISPECIES: T6SS effector amidase Tae4 family protein [Helicobacter]|uniref:T6SS effector amidase Tae4 family protein n=1 Tax=Helicobacter TaxID=209 RepID=UPI0009B7621A|nr:MULTISPECIES: T6SS effector amidase Tae4 family protein [Helicobacter]